MSAVPAIDRALDADPYVTSHPSSRAFWRGAADGVFLLPRCHDCGRWHWYPRAFCPFCHRQHVALESATGTGRVYAFSWLERVPSPLLVAYVRLSEGPIMLTNLVGCAPEAVRIDDQVVVSFRPAAEGRMVPVFSLAAQVPVTVQAPADG